MILEYRIRNTKFHENRIRKDKTEFRDQGLESMSFIKKETKIFKKSKPFIICPATLDSLVNKTPDSYECIVEGKLPFNSIFFEFLEPYSIHVHERKGMQDIIGIHLYRPGLMPEITEVIENKDFYSRIHRPVFYGIFKNHNKGFVQIDWLSNKVLPDHISEKYDYNKDGLIDFKIDFYPAEKRIYLKKYNERVLNLLDKTSMGLLNLRGFSDSRYSIFTYNDFQEALLQNQSFL